jgi:two-component system, chemotaxis family, CheB/CheR fusion protein
MSDDLSKTDDLSKLALLAGVISIAPDAIISVDYKQRINLFNEGAEQTFGYRRDEVLGHPLALLLPERFRDDHVEHIRKFTTSRETGRLMGERQEIFALHKDGHEFPAEAAISKLEMDEQQIFTVVLRDVTERKRREEHIRFLMRELEHRVSNVLHRFRVVVERTPERQVSVPEFRNALLARIEAMTRAHTLLGRSKWRGVTIRDLVTDQLSPYVIIDDIRVEGPEIVFNADATQALSMVIHELATNAAKYGALSTPEGRVTVSWQRAPAQGTGEALLLQWSEQGGPAVKAPEREGYGTSVIRELVTFEFDGVVRLRYSPGGVTCEISVPLDSLLANPDRIAEIG